MPKKKSKKKKKGNFKNYRLFLFVGGIFHLIVYLLYDKTFYSSTLFWTSLLICGGIFGIYFITKMQLTNPKTYRKLKGLKLKLCMSFACIIFILGGCIIFGNVVNGIIIGANYIGKKSESYKVEYKIEKILQDKTGGRKRIRRNNPKVYFEKDKKIERIRLPEYYRSTENYAEFKTIEFTLNKGLLGFEVVENYRLNKK